MNDRERLRALWTHCSDVAMRLERCVRTFEEKRRCASCILLGRLCRLPGNRRGYLEKEELEAELPFLSDALLMHLANAPRPDVIHAHFADAAELAFTGRWSTGFTRSD